MADALLAIAHDRSPYVTIYEQDGTTFTKLANPAVLPPDDGNGAAWDSSGTYLAIAHDTSPYVTVYERSGTTFTKLANPATLPTGTGRGAAWDSSGTYLAITHSVSPFVTIYERSGSTFTKLANPATLPTGTGYGASWDPSGTYLAIAHTTSPYVTVYERSGTTLTKLADPAALPTNTSTGASWDPSGTYLAIAHITSPYVTVYERSGSTFTKLADPATLPTSFGDDAAWDSSGTYLAVTHSGSPYVTIYERSGTTLNKLANPATLPDGYGRGAAWDSSGTYLAVAHDSSPYTTIYERSGTTFTKLANPAVLPPNDGNGAAFLSLNTAPNAPTGLSPDGATINKNITQRFSWTFSDPDVGDLQSAYDLRYRLVGNPTWIDVSGGATQYHDFAGGTFTAGDWEWQVRTTDNGGEVGPYSSSATFTAAAAPSAPAIFEPINAGTVNTDPYTVEWTAPAQDAFQVRTVADLAGSPDTGTIYQDTGTIEQPATRARSMPFPTNGRDEHVQVRVRSGGLWSTYASVIVSVSYTAPAAPTAVVVADNVNAGIGIAIGNPTPVGSEPTVTSNNVWVRVAAGGRADGERTVDGDGIRIKTGVANGGAFTDYAAASGVDYEYRIEAVGDNGTRTSSVWT